MGPSSEIQAIPLPRFTANGQEYIRYAANDWRYADDEEIQVPGGRDMRLSERFDPIIGSKGGTREIIVVDGADVEGSPETLGWTLKVGTPVRSERGALLQVIVPYESWEAHDQIEGIMVAPELSDDEGIRRLAAAQRELRKTELHLAQQTKERDKLLVELAETGMTRQRAAEITGLSVGKVQQIIKREELAPNELQLVRMLEEASNLNIGQIVEHAKETEGLTKTRSKLKKYLTALQTRGFLHVDSEGHWLLTEKGRRELAKHPAQNSSTRTKAPSTTTEEEVEPPLRTEQPAGPAGSKTLPTQRRSASSQPSAAGNEPPAITARSLDEGVDG